MKCSSCGNENDAGKKYCVRCGAELQKKKIKMAPALISAALVVVIAVVGVWQLSYRRNGAEEVGQEGSSFGNPASTASADRKDAYSDGSLTGGVSGLGLVGMYWYEYSPESPLADEWRFYDGGVCTRESYLEDGKRKYGIKKYTYRIDENLLYIDYGNDIERELEMSLENRVIYSYFGGYNPDGSDDDSLYRLTIFGYTSRLSSAEINEGIDDNCRNGNHIDQIW